MKLLNRHRELISSVDAQYNAAGNTQSLKKLHGALTAEMIRDELLNYFIQHQLPFKPSKQNVYIVGLANEFDILIAKVNAEPTMGILYKPEDVVAIIEVKSAGLINPEKEANAILNIANRVYEKYPHIAFGYLTMIENSPVNSISWGDVPTVDHWRITQDVLGRMRQRNAQLAVVHHNAGKDVVSSDEEWDAFITHLCSGK